MNKLSVEQGELAKKMQVIGKNARFAATELATASGTQKNMALRAMAKAMRDLTDDILAENQKDISAAQAKDYPESFIDRLFLDADRIESIAAGIEVIEKLDDPVGTILSSWSRPNGLLIERVRVPLGVIGIIYESRPNVTADAGALCLKSGNAVILRGGSDSYFSSQKITQALKSGLLAAGLSENCIQIVPDTDRAAVGMMLSGLDGNLDVIIPRGGKSLVARVQDEAKVPVFSHLDGICHVYIDANADPEMAQEIILNAKMRRTGICGAAETLLLDQNLDVSVQKDLINALLKEGCEVRGDEAAQRLSTEIKPANAEDWSTEYLDAIISAKMVDGVQGAVEHIRKYSSNHTESIVTDSEDHAEQFLNEVDSAIIMHNASTQFADGGEFGMGAEIGISTGKMHARGPVGVEQLTTFKYKVRGSGQVRPK